MMEAKKQDPIVEILRHELELKKKRNSSYSLRAFSKSLGVDASNLSKILNYQVLPGDKLKKKLAKGLGLKSNDFMNGLHYRKSEDQAYDNHSLDLFNIISDWQHYAILELIKLKKYQGKLSPKEMSHDLGISLDEFNKAINRLSRLGLIEVDLTNELIKNTEDSSSSILNVATSKAHRNQQKQLLEKAIDALDDVPVELRSQSSMTLAIDKNKLVEAKELIKDFRRKLGRFLSDSDELNDVYQLSVSLYPTTTISNQETTK